MTDKTPRAVPSTVRKLSCKDQLLLCKLTGFQVEDNLAIKKELADKRRVSDRDTESIIKK